ncbi:PadR family transcriptional regulator [Deinococcus cellulosilyticus]|uniref:Pex-like protein n=1 Tax=Deinococcus cellulosilyticus (strain DSM 18568 / NBRC 106333 / KACC 11606 / 5516J-15) TaxID=1223518 RepID=A0A511MYZ6_DEIC1|nr:helix-turn-helix transcriptional regulator [Deinococcus cellulosilyticus]GEM45825.1 Pex-like protein [Deinococcus cellulosilyticus NBRC 106333 = KACC 11606]
MDSNTKLMALDLVLLSVLEDRPAYGLEILERIQARTGENYDFKEGSLYPALHRMVKQGWLDSTWEESQKGGAPRRYYSLSAPGKQALEQKKLEWARLRQAMDGLLGGV